jgi:pimeloyl-ACP methyl ester carboxylesterase
MSTVFVHGAPETAAVWEPLLAEVKRQSSDELDLICLSPPGFGAPVPAGFGATIDDYRDWLISELEQFREPVDLVGHDWGGGHTLNVVMSRPELVRSWVSDVIGLYHPDYVWHGMAQRLQRPEYEEKDVTAPMGPVLETRVAALVGLGMSEPVAQQVAKGQNLAMGQVAYTLYRSAVQPAMAERGQNLERAAQAPGLVVLATEDDVAGTAEQRRQCAQRAGAQVATLEGLGHWWMTQDPERAARVLLDFWASVDHQ